MIGSLTSRLGRWLTALVAALAFVVGVFAYGRKTERKDQEVRDLKAYQETKERMDEVTPAADPDDAVERLRANGLIRDSPV